MRIRSILAAATLALIAPGALAEGDPAATDYPTLWAAQKNDELLPPQERALGDRTSSLGETAPAKSYAVPAAEIAGFNLLLNLFDRTVLGGSDFDSNGSTARRNLRSGWVEDRDTFTINQVGHPYQGSMYHGFARSAGLTYWESLPYALAGSAMWEIAGETTPPSRNDLITTGIGGTFLGEALFRMASLVLERGGGIPREWREAAAAAISPATGFNRLAMGDRYKSVFSSRDAAVYARLQFGASGTTQNTPGASTELKRNEALADFSMDYGMPGQPGYQYRRPFDYFSFQGIASSANGLESVMTRGLLLGTDYGVGKSYRGLWGLYGSYDYLSPQLFRVSSTALSLGTTGQWWMTPSIAVQGTGMLGAGYASVGTVNSLNIRDNHYGIAPQALLAMRLIFGERAALDFSVRDYFVSRVGGAGADGRDNIIRGDASLTVRIHKQHAVSVKYLLTRRDASFTGVGEITQTRGTLGVFYTLVNQNGFGIVGK